MVKSVTSFTGNGLRDWLAQRITSVYLAIGFIALLTYFGLHTPLDYNDWSNLFAQQWLKIATLLFFVSLAIHAWIGLWTITADYLKGTSTRLLIHIVILGVLISALVWSATILWGQ